MSFGLKRVPFVFAVLLCPLSRLTAQEAPALEPGARVRVSTAAKTASPVWVVGTVVEVTGDRLTIRPQQDSGRTVDIARAAVTQLQVSSGQDSKALTGLGLGFVVGAVVGGAIGYAALHEGHDLASQDAALIGAAPGALVGALLGLAIGSDSKTDRWEDTPVTLAVTGGAPGSPQLVRVSVNLRFHTP